MAGIDNHIALPTVSGMAAEDSAFVGVLYCGLMMTAGVPWCWSWMPALAVPRPRPFSARLDCDLVGDARSLRRGPSERRHRAAAGSPGPPRASSRPRAAARQLRNRAQDSGLEEAGQVPGVEIFRSGTALVDGIT